MGASDSRRYPVRPLLGVGALIFDGNRVLLVQRGKEPLSGQWSLPGGMVESGERLEDAVIREVYEETGLDVVPDSIATVFERIMPDEAGRCEYHYVVVDFYCSVRGGDLRPGDDARSLDWFDVNDLASVAVTPGTRQVVQSCCSTRSTQPRVTRPQNAL